MKLGRRGVQQLGRDLAVAWPLARPAGLDRTHGVLWIVAPQLHHDEGQEDERDVPDPGLIYLKHTAPQSC
jgi:hypothetical protein